MMAAEFVARLRGVRETSRGCWVARCPAHEDRHPSMSIRELPDGRILMHCFAGCEPSAIVAAVGVELSDLMGESRETFRPARAAFPARDVLECVAQEALIVAICARHLERGGVLDGRDASRLRVARQRLEEAANVVR